MAVQTGRPRLDYSEDFRRGFARILPALLERKVSKGEAARRLGISPRSLRRYLAADEKAQEVAQAEAFARLVRVQRQSFNEPAEDIPPSD